MVLIHSKFCTTFPFVYICQRYNSWLYNNLWWRQVRAPWPMTHLVSILWRNDVSVNPHPPHLRPQIPQSLGGIYSVGWHRLQGKTFHDNILGACTQIILIVIDFQQRERERERERESHVILLTPLLVTSIVFISWWKKKDLQNPLHNQKTIKQKLRSNEIEVH